MTPQQRRELLTLSAAALRPPASVTLSEWAKEYLRLSKENSARPGRFQPFAFQVEPMDCLSATHPCDRVVLMCGSQVMKTLIIQAATAYAIHVEQGPILIVEPRETDAEAFSQDRLDPMLRDTPALHGLVADKKSRDSGNTKLYKRFRGGSITLVGSNAPANLAMRSVRWLFFDEVDRYELSAGKEGDPIRLGRQRASTYPNRKELMCSTPSIEGLSRIATEFALSDQRYFEVPCPHCGEYQILRWDNVKWGDHNNRYVKPEHAEYECDHCHKRIKNWQKIGMLERGRWHATNPEGRFPGFHLSQLYSPFKSWGELAVDFVECGKDTEKLKTFVNTVLGETWRDRGEVPDWEKLAARAETYKRGRVPEGVAFLTAGVDVQKGRIEASIWGWGRNRERWLVDHIILEGDVDRDEVWHALTAEVLNSTWSRADGGEFNLARLAIDSGHATQRVYDWARRQGAGRVLVVKGTDQGAALLGQPSTAESSRNGKRVKRGVMVWPVNVSQAKSELYGSLRQDRPGPGELIPSGWVHTPDGMQEEWYRQLCSEHYVIRVVKGFRKGAWEPLRDRNEALDCANYARAAAEHAGWSRMNDVMISRLMDGVKQDAALKASKAQSGVTQASVAKPAHRAPTTERATDSSSPGTQSPARPPVSSGWMSGGRRGGWFQR